LPFKPLPSKNFSAGGLFPPALQFFMPRISRLDRSQVADDVGAVYDHFMKVRGNVPNMFRTVAHRPEILKTMIAHFRAVMETGTVSAKLKELVITRTSQINRCEY
jgi:alkylhydroperoxidase family enzyme